jgi:hypothetical protein
VIILYKESYGLLGEVLPNTSSYKTTESNFKEKNKINFLTRRMKPPKRGFSDFIGEAICRKTTKHDLMTPLERSGHSTTVLM